MRGLWYVFILVLGTGLMAACDRDEESGGLATAPSLASAAASVPTLIKLSQPRSPTIRLARRSGHRAEHGPAFGANQKGKATWYGFQVLEAIDTAGRFQGTLPANSNLAVGTFPCMSLGPPLHQSADAAGTRRFRRPRPPDGRFRRGPSRTTGPGSSSPPRQLVAGHRRAAAPGRHHR